MKRSMVGFVVVEDRRKSKAEARWWLVRYFKLGHIKILPRHSTVGGGDADHVTSQRINEIDLIMRPREVVW